MFGAIPAPGQPNGPVQVIFRPEAVNIAPLNGGVPGHVVVPGTVVESRFIGVARLVRVQVTAPGEASTTLQVRASGSYAPEPGSKVGLWLDPSQAFVFGPGTAPAAEAPIGAKHKIANPPLAEGRTRA
jgi:hypothetical protein